MGVEEGGGAGHALLWFFCLLLSCVCVWVFAHLFGLNLQSTEFLKSRRLSSLFLPRLSLFVRKLTNFVLLFSGALTLKVAFHALILRLIGLDL